jgi:Protein of unknown function (DUF2934)
MTIDRDQRVRERAYFIWIEDGRPSGHDQEHWRIAEDEIAIEEDALKPGERGPLPNPFEQLTSRPL